MEDLLYQLLQIARQKPKSISESFKKIDTKELKTENNILITAINDSTKEISSFLDDSIQKFPSLFECELKSFEECLKHLEKISVPNKCICAGIINEIPGWQCIDCSKYENTIYCHNCFIKSRDLHKNHKVLYSYNSGGMCDCGDPDSLYQYCSEHSGPFTDQKQIDEYIQQSFSEKVLYNLKAFFDEFFIKFSKYFILTAKCDLFMEDIYNEYFNDENPEMKDKLEVEKSDVDLVKSNFCIIFQNFIYFLRLITKKNIGMLHLIFNYFLKSNFDSQKLEDNYMTEHRCIEIIQNDIKILYDNNKKEKHICKCPFLRLYFENYRDNIKLDSSEDEKEFLLYFSHNLFMRKACCIIYFFIYEKNIYNNNNINKNISQFYIEDALELLMEKTNFFEDCIDIFIKYIIRLLKIKKNEDKYEYNFQENSLEKISDFLSHILYTIQYFSKPKVKILMTNKTLYYKRIIDLICLFHNINQYKSILPHPKFQDKEFHIHLFYIENIINIIPRTLNCFLEYDKLEKLKEIYKYIIYKILNQKKEGIQQLKNDEYSFHLSLYRCFGSFINSFCFNYSFINNCTLLESINYFKKYFFESQEQIENIIDIVLKDYFKFFGFLNGTRNNFFNYYEKLDRYYKLYMIFDYFQNDFTLLKYLFILTEKKIDINSYLELSSIEDVYSHFDNIFSIKFNQNNIDNNKEIKNDNSLNIRINLDENLKSEDKKSNEFNIIMQWKMLFEIFIYLLKDDSCAYWNLINNYKNNISSKTNKELFDKIRNNKNAMEDLKNILQEKLIHNIISNNNLIDKKNLDQKMDEYLLILFEENNLYNQTIDELTYNKKNGETRMFYLKDEYLKFLDCNYYFNSQDKSNAQKYILDFKKDIIKTYNYHYYNNSKLTFDFHETVYQKALLNKNNLELIIKIIEKLINAEKISEELDKNSIRNSLLPVILNYLLMFNVINSKSFIEFKLENKNVINKIYEILFNFIKNNGTDKNNNKIDKDLEDHIKEVLNQINNYQIIYDYYKGDLSKLNKYDYNINILEQILKVQNKEINSINTMMPENRNPKEEKKQKAKNIKDKLKNKMKKKSNNIIQELESNETIKNIINEGMKEIENIKKNKNDEIMCFYCRKSIKLNSFEAPYGKLGEYFKDLFYSNSIKATLREELSNSELKENLVETVDNIRYPRIISCGHYFHFSCFSEGIKKDNEGFNCPLCLKKQNILIPPLTLFHDKYDFLKSEKLKNLFDEKINKKAEEIDEKSKSEKDIDLFKDFALDFLTIINFLNERKENDKSFNLFLEDMYPFYKAYLNYLENMFYLNTTSFHKHQQIDNFKNMILAIRLHLNNSKKEIAEYFKNTILDLINIKEETKFIYNYNDSYMHYLNLFEKISLALIILFDYEELKVTFKYILYLFFPYFTFGLYFKKLLIDNFDNKESLKQKLNINEFNKYLKADNENVVKCLTEFLKKFCFIKFISDYNNENEKLINSFNELSLIDILRIIDMDDLVKILPQKELNINDIIINLPKIFNAEEIIYNLISPDFKVDKILETIFEKIQSEENLEINKELIIQFIPIKFNFIKLDKNIFDFVIGITGKECCECQSIEKRAYICLICGEKVCQPSDYITKEALAHIRNCSAYYNIYIMTEGMNCYYFDLNKEKLRLMPLYVNENGTGPKDDEISDNYNLSEENLKLLIKNYVCRDFNFTKRSD